MQSVESKTVQKEEVANAAAAIRAAIKGLDKRAVGLDEYRDSIVLKKPEGIQKKAMRHIKMHMMR